MAQKTWWAYNWQRERKLEKEQEIKERLDKLRMQVILVEDIDQIN